MKKNEIIKSANEFNNIIHTGKYLKNNYFVIYYINNDNDYPHFGIAVGTKIGNAVTRNKYKRILKSIVDENKNLFSKGNNYIIILKKACLNLDFSTLSDNLVNLITEEQ